MKDDTTRIDGTSSREIEINISQTKQPFLFVDVGRGYIIKYDGYRKKNKWTLLHKKGERILDGCFFDIVNWLGKKGE